MSAPNLTALTLDLSLDFEAAKEAARRMIFAAAFAAAFERGTEPDADGMRSDLLLSACFGAGRKAGDAAYNDIGINYGCMVSTVRTACYQAFQCAGDHRRALKIEVA